MAYDLAILAFYLKEQNARAQTDRLSGSATWFIVDKDDSEPHFHPQWMGSNLAYSQNRLLFCLTEPKESPYMPHLEEPWGHYTNGKKTAKKKNKIHIKTTAEHRYLCDSNWGFPR